MATSWTPGNDFLPTTHGHFVKLPALSPDNGSGGPANGANAWFEDKDGKRIHLWVTEIGAGFALGGKTAQGPTRRDFYPHNLVQPSINIRGQTPNQMEYYRIANFIRQTHIDAVIDWTVTDHARIMRFACVAPDEVKDGRGVRGRPSFIDVDGFIVNAPKKTERFVNAPEYNLSFVVTNVRSFLRLQDDVYTSRKFEEITGIFRNRSGYEASYYQPPAASSPLMTPGPNGEMRPN